ncbi:hypothetical protein CBS101457_000210 [Exobasidium rhododendri]|nr:hypothetical protein CBS101457_000210 [Exobasidium rhododendri]
MDDGHHYRSALDPTSKLQARTPRLRRINTEVVGHHPMENPDSRFLHPSIRAGSQTARATVTRGVVKTRSIRQIVEEGDAPQTQHRRKDRPQASRDRSYSHSTGNIGHHPTVALLRPSFSIHRALDSLSIDPRREYPNHQQQSTDYASESETESLSLYADSSSSYNPSRASTPEEHSAENINSSSLHRTHRRRQLARQKHPENLSDTACSSYPPEELYDSESSPRQQHYAHRSGRRNRSQVISSPDSRSEERRYSFGHPEDTEEAGSAHQQQQEERGHRRRTRRITAIMRQTRQSPPGGEQFQQFVAPHEHTIPVDSRFHFNNLDDLAYDNLTYWQKASIIDRIQQIRPYTSDDIRSRLTTDLRAYTAFLLLNDEDYVVEGAVETLFPDDQRKEAWMWGFPSVDRRLVMQKLAEATGQSIEYLRDLFVERGVRQGVAQEILDAPTLTRCSEIVASYGIQVWAGTSASSWRDGISHLQQLAVQHRMIEVGGLKPDKAARCLEMASVPSGFGWEILRADDEQFNKIMRWLKQTRCMARQQ